MAVITVRNRWRVVLSALLVLVAVVIYFNTFFNGFVSDDISAILNNVWLRDVRYIPKFFGFSLWSFLPTEVFSNFYRPFELLFFMFGHMISAQDTWGYHLVNITLHSASGILVFLIAQRLLLVMRSPIGEGRALLLAFISALLFVTNPVNTEAVAWASAASELSFAFFFLLALYLYMRGRRYLSALFFIFAVFSKETGLVLPLLLVCFDLSVRREPVFPLRPWIKRYLPYITLFVFYTALRYNAIGGIAPYESDEKLLSVFHYILNIIPLTVEFVKTILLPTKLIFFDYIRLDHITSFWEVRNFLYIALFMGFVYILKRLRGKEPALFFTMIWVVVPLLPIFYLGWNQGEPTFAERYAYIPSAGLSITVVLISLALIRYADKHAMKDKAFVVICLFFVIVSIVFSVATVRRNRVWRDSITLWHDTVVKSPGNITARISYAGQLIRHRRFDEAKDEYRLLLRSLPDNAQAHNGLGIVYAETGLIDRAIFEFREALRARPDFKKARANLEMALKFKSAR